MAYRQSNADEEKLVIQECLNSRRLKGHVEQTGQEGSRCALVVETRRSAPAGENEMAKVQNAILPFGYKHHVSIDRSYGFVRRFAITNAAADEGVRLTDVHDKSNMASPSEFDAES
jgi:hypothetical protein